MISKAVESNSSITCLELYLPSRDPDFFAEEDDNISLVSLAPSTAYSHSENVKVLGKNSSVTDYRVYGYLNTYGNMLFGGLAGNSSVRRLNLENIDMDRDSLPGLVKSFNLNHSIQQLNILRGLNTISGMTIFHSLRLNNSITELYVTEGTFNEGGYQVLS
jgi:hypothetical protein